MTEKYVNTIKELLFEDVCWYIFAVIVCVIVIMVKSPAEKRLKEIILVVIIAVLFLGLQKTPLIVDLSSRSIIKENNIEYRLEYSGKSRHYTVYMDFVSRETKSNIQIKIPSEEIKNIPEKGRATIVYAKHSKYLLDFETSEKPADSSTSWQKSWFFTSFHFKRAVGVKTNRFSIYWHKGWKWV